MKIYTQCVYRSATGKWSAVEENYAGEVAYGKGGSEVVNQTIPTGPWANQIPFINQLFQGAQELYNQGPPQAYDGQLTPNNNPNLANTQGAVGTLAGNNIDQNNAIQQWLQTLGQGGGPGNNQFGQSFQPGITSGINQQLNAGNNALANSAQGQLGNTQGAYNSIFNQNPNAGNVNVTGTQGGGTDVSGALGQQLAGGGGTNPYLDQLVQAATRSQTNAFDRDVLPGIRTQAQQAGQIGGTRHGIADGIAGSELQQSIGDTTAQIYGNAFGQQAALQGQAVNSVLQAQQGDQSAQLQGAQINNQNMQQYIQSLLQGTGQVGDQLGQGLGLGYDAVGTGTAQAGNLYQGGSQLQMQQMLSALGLIPNYQAGSLGQFGAVNQLGLQQYGQDQNAIQQLMNQYYYNQNSPFNLLSQYQQYVTGPYGSSLAGPSGGDFQNIPWNPNAPQNTQAPN